MKQYLAFDLGASSGRAILGSLQDGKLVMQEVHRFENGGTDINGHLHWNLLGLFGELKTGLRKAVETGADIAGMAIDTWGVDYAMLNSAGSFAGFPYHYRDSRTDDGFEYVFGIVPREEVYARTGIQFMTLNTLYQLAVMVRDSDPILDIADQMLLMPNALTYCLCGDVSAEYTHASTTQLYDPFSRDWAWDLIDKLQIPRRIFPRIKQPGSVAGMLRKSLCEELNCPEIPVFFVGSHDTASAVAAVPATHDKTWAYLSSGTWSLLGVELDEALVSDQARELNFTNEGGVGGKIRFLKNIMGLWLVQESRNTWRRRGEEISFDDLDAEAEASEPFRSLIDVTDQRFAAPGDMPVRIAAYCRETGQPVPETQGQVIRCAQESLALCYRQTIDELEQVMGKTIDVLHLVGGGIKNTPLNRFTADAIARPVLTGPIEATAAGNLLCQAMAAGDIPDLQGLREIVQRTSQGATYEPQDTAGWEAAYRRYRGLITG